MNKPPRPVFPLRREGMAAHKVSMAALGSYGSVSWVINNKRFIMMWSVPYSHDFFVNTLAIGIKNTHTKADTKSVSINFSLLLVL